MKQRLRGTALCSALLATWGIDYLLKSDMYFGFYEYRHLLIVITFIISLLLSAAYFLKVEKAEKEYNIKRWELRNIGRYEVFALLAGVVYFIPFPSVDFVNQLGVREYLPYIRILKGLLCMYAFLYFLKQGYHQKNKTN